ncbi:MAG: EMC3/TMCO1 family protein [Nanoarchaeota archaeon]
MYAFLDPILLPFLHISPLISIIILSFLISLFITIVYKYVTDQNLMKQLKDEMNTLQTEMKTLRDNPQKALSVQKQVMETNMKYMMQSLKPTILTLLPLIIIFGWLSAHYAYEPIKPGQEFAILLHGEIDGNNATLYPPLGITLLDEPTKKITANKARWGLKAEAGNHIITIGIGNTTFHKKILVTTDRSYEPVSTPINADGIQRIDTEQSELKLLNIFGWEIGWLGTYILFSILFSMILRKVLKVY